MHFIGIDGGGTKTLFTLFTEDGRSIKSIQLGSCHILQKDPIEIKEILKAGVQNVLKNCKDKNIVICAGFGGYGSDAGIRQKIESICAEAFYPYPHCIKGDTQIALAGALNGEDGILLIAGTGSIAFAKQGDQELRCGGWGYMLGDEGSAYGIAKSLLSHYCKQCDGREVKTELVNVVKNACGFEEDYGIISYVAHTLQNQRDKIAKLALIASELAAKKDPAAIAIFHEAGIALAQLANSLAIHFNDKVNLSYVGGVWKSNDYIMKPFLSHLNSNINILKPIHEPVYGAYLLARNHKI